MSIAAVVRALVSAGATPEMILAAVEAAESAGVDVLAKRRAADAARQRAKRERAEAASRDSRDVTVTERDSADLVCAQVVNTTLPSEEVITPLTLPSGATPRKAKNQTSGSRLADDWWPVPDYDPAAFGLSREQHDAELAKFRDYWRAVPGAKGRKSDWPATWRNWMRRAVENRPRAQNGQRPDDRRETRNRIWSEILAEECGPRTGLPARTS